jgi:hypothetical protein
MYRNGRDDTAETRGGNVGVREGGDALQRSR